MFLEVVEELPNWAVEGLGIKEAKAAAIVVIVPHNRRICLSLQIVSLPLAIRVGGNIQVLGVLNLLLSEFTIILVCGHSLVHILIYKYVTDISYHSFYSFYKSRDTCTQRLNP